jgi:DNA-binding winged helix-turn-helix (wHTH) protein
VTPEILIDTTSTDSTGPINAPAESPWPPHTRRLQVDDLTIDLWYRQLASPGQTVELPQRVFDLLQLFLAQPHTLHTRAALLERVWPGVVVEDANLSQSIWMLRKALGEPRRHWVRTLAKSGYVFEPPAPILPLAVDDMGAAGIPGGASTGIADEPARDAAGLDTEQADAANVGVDAQAEAGVDVPECPAIDPAAASAATPSATALRSRPDRASGQRRGLLIVALALSALALGIASLFFAAKPPTSPPAPASPIAVAMIDVGNHNNDEARWPATLLRAWLGWKLDALPEVVVLTEAHLAADTAALSPNIVLLSSGQATNAPDQRFVRARFDGVDGSRQIELRGSTAQVPQLVDELSRQVLAELVPARRDELWPALSVDAGSARDYALAYEAYSQRDMSASATGLASVLAQAPRFGLAHLQLAMSLARLGQANPALAHMQHARELLSPLSADVAWVMDAMQLSIDPQRRAETATAFSDLAAQYPQNLSYRLEQSRYQLRAGDPEAALATLSRADWETQPTGVRIQWLVLLAEIEMARINPDAVRLHATEAERLAHAAGQGWEHERATALLLKAQSDAYQWGELADRSQFDEAARLFTEAGADIDALHAKVTAELSLPPSGPSAQLDSLLAQTRAGGYRSMEIQLLRRVAFQHYNAGDLVEYRKRLEQALACATHAGDAVAQLSLDVSLLNEDLLAGRFSSAEERIRRIRKGHLKGDLATWLDQFEAFTLNINGDYAGALQALDQTAQRLAREGRAPLPAVTTARLACVRADSLLAQGKLPQARQQLADCADTTQPFVRDQAEGLGTAIDLLAGDTASAVPRLRARNALIQAMPDAPDRWMVALQNGYQLARAGQLDDAERLYSTTRASLQKSGYDWLLADAEIGLAEVATARGQWPQARRLADSARRHLPDDGIWLQSQRLGQIATLAALADGQRDRAHSLFTATHARAHALGDVVAQMELHSLMAAAGFPDDPLLADCDANARAAQIAATGMRGATVDWLARALPQGNGRQTMAAVASDRRGATE